MNKKQLCFIHKADKCSIKLNSTKVGCTMQQFAGKKRDLHIQNKQINTVEK